jgi:hypothetical protein
MNTSTLSLVPLQQASLCLDCDMITPAHTHCSACGSAALLNLARTLNGGEYARQIAATHAAVTSISERRMFEMPALVNPQSQWPRRLAGECVPFPQASRTVSVETISGETTQTRPWHSFREVAAVVHRALTIAIIGILIRGASMPVWGQSLEHFAGAGKGRTQTYSRSSAGSWSM